ncbi:MAG: TonB-dependent receptor [Hyphomicrobiaceae bacterium]|nr:TonB-dependent receptor [Hyphomicrobiaceae bacterium]
MPCPFHRTARALRLTLLMSTALPLIAATGAVAQSATPLPPIEVGGTGAPETSGASSGVTGNGERVTPGTRSGSLGVPNVAEARAEIETTPGGVDLVTAEEYKNSTPAVTIKDALDYVPGVFVQPKWGEDSRLSIRGSGLSRNFHGRGVTLLMDGLIPITTADGSSDFQEIDPTAYRYIEVYKGSNALRYGANSLGGAINFVMPTGYDTETFGARLDVGSFGFHKLAASSGGVYGAADYFMTGTWQEQDGFRDHSEGESVRGAMNIGYRLSPDIETRMYLNANHVRQRIPGAVTRSQALTDPSAAFTLPGQPAGFASIGNDNVDRDYQRNLETIRVANRTTMRLAPGTVVELGGFYFHRHLDHPIFAVIDNLNNEYGGFGRVVNDSLVGGLRNRFVAGVAVHNGDVRSRLYRNELRTKGALFSDADQTSQNTTLYGENALHVLPSLALIGGIQYSDTSRKLEDRFLSNGNQSGEADFSSWSPKAGLIWSVTPSAEIFANISRSSEFPTFSEITITGISTTALEPQRATTYEIGTRGSRPGFSWDLALYRANLDDEFLCLSTGALGTCTQINVDRSIHQGVEAGASVRLFSGLIEPARNADSIWLNTAYTFSDFRFSDDPVFGDNELPGAPRHFVRAELLYKHPSGVYFGPNVEWVPEAYYVDSANTLQTEAYALLGAKLGFDDGGPLSAYVEARNLTDEAYIASANIATRADATSPLFEPGSGRAVYGGVRVKW